MKSIQSTLNVLSYLSRRREMMLRLSFLGIIVSFAFCSNRLHALNIKNGLSVELEIVLISESKSVHDLGEYSFVGIPEGGIVIQPGDSIKIDNIVMRLRQVVGAIIKPDGVFNKIEALFRNLVLTVKYEHQKERHLIYVGNLSQENIKHLKAGSIGIIVEIPESETARDKVYFDKRGNWNELNARLYKTMQHRPEE